MSKTPEPSTEGCQIGWFGYITDFMCACPGCGHIWPLRSEHLRIRSCASDGMYGLEVECPGCQMARDIYC